MNPIAKQDISGSARIAFIGGGNMASAIIAGLLRQGWQAAQLSVVEPVAQARESLRAQWALQVFEQADERLNGTQLVVWAVKPQTFATAAAAVRAHTPGALHLSVAAGIRSDTIARWLGSERVVRAMPNTPALVGQGITGLFARPGVNEADQALVQQVVAATGEHVWVQEERLLDAVTALSGSGPAYVFYFLESMVQAGTAMGLSESQARHLAVSTFAGAAELARRSDESLSVLRERVTSKGGTTHAALTTLDQHQVQTHFVAAMHAACARATELGDEFGS